MIHTRLKRLSFKESARLAHRFQCKANLVSHKCLVANKDHALKWKRTFADTRIIHDRLCTERSTSGSRTFGAVTMILSYRKSSRKCFFTQVASARTMESSGTNSFTSSSSSLQKNNPDAQTQFRQKDTSSHNQGLFPMLRPRLENNSLLVPTLLFRYFN